MTPALPRRVFVLAVAALVAVAAGSVARGQEDRPGGGRRGGGARGGGNGEEGRGGPAGIFRTEIPAHDIDVVAGRPTARSVVVSVLAARDTEAYVTFGPPAGVKPSRTETRKLAAGVPTEFTLEPLLPDSAYAARVLVRAAEGTDFADAGTVSFHTQRAPGAAFAFTVQADSHLDQGTQPALYERTLANVAADAPDFHVDLGDTFMVDKRRDDFRASLPQYVAQRWYLSLPRVPVFLVLGNHDGETGWRDRGAADDMPHWSNAQRKRYFPTPEPDAFYTGNGARDPVAGALRNWYGWEWGDAQFLVLDPFWSTRERKGRDADGWTWTLGEAQFRWLEKSLASSRAKVRFVFIHHLVGGLDSEARGGSEAARLFEWGGRSADGKDEFAQRRPGWTAPVHELLRRAGNAVVFHGHDHFFARQDLDGVVYQMVPQPGHPGGDAKRMAAEYGYVTGDFLPSPGHVRVRVAADGATVEFVRSSLADPRANGTVAFTYRVAAPPPAGAPR